MENWTEPAPKEKTKKRKTNKDEEKKEVATWLNKNRKCIITKVNSDGKDMLRQLMFITQ